MLYNPKWEQRTTDTFTVTMLKRARALIENPDHWGQTQFERGGRRCLLGALGAVNHGSWEPARSAILSANGIDSIANFNDSSTHAQVLTAIDRAIAAETGQSTMAS